MKNHNWTY